MTNRVLFCGVSGLFINVENLPRSNSEGVCVCFCVCKHREQQPRLQACTSLCLMCRGKHLSTNDKMRLALNFRYDASNPTGHRLVLIFFFFIYYFIYSLLSAATMRTTECDCVLCQHDVTAALPVFVALDRQHCHGKSIP